MDESCVEFFGTHKVLSHSKTWFLSLKTGFAVRKPLFALSKVPTFRIVNLILLFENNRSHS